MSDPVSCFLRKYTSSDLENLGGLFTDVDAMRYVGDGAIEQSAVSAMMDKILDMYSRDPSFMIWAIQEGDEYAGHAELKRRKGRTEYELIYILQPGRWGRSLGTLVVDLLLGKAREHRIPFVIATVAPENVRSIAILRRHEFILDGRLSTELSCKAYRLDLKKLPGKSEHT